MSKRLLSISSHTHQRQLKSYKKRKLTICLHKIVRAINVAESVIQQISNFVRFELYTVTLNQLNLIYTQIWYFDVRMYVCMKNVMKPLIIFSSFVIFFLHFKFNVIFPFDFSNKSKSSCW